MSLILNDIHQNSVLNKWCKYNKNGSISSKAMVQTRSKQGVKDILINGFTNIFAHHGNY